MHHQHLAGLQGFGGDGSSPHSRGAGDDNGGSPALNGLGLSSAFANAGLLDQALRGLTPPSPVSEDFVSICLTFVFDDKGSRNYLASGRGSFNCLSSAGLASVEGSIPLSS